MRESEERALQAYPDQMGPSDKPCYDDDARVTRKLREAFQEGYEKALEDHPPICPPLPEPLRLTWQDIRRIDFILDQMMDEDILEDEEGDIDDEDYYTEALNRFNKKKPE